MTLKRPTADGFNGSVVTTPGAAQMMSLLGSGVVTGGVALTRDEFNAVKKLYGFTAEKPNQKPPPPAVPKREDFDAPWKHEQALKDHERALKAHETWQDPRALMQAGADRNVLRDAECDGLRLLAYLARFVPVGEDPVKTLVQLASESGWDTNPSDVEWAETEEGS